MNLEKFKELLSVPSKTYQEEDMVEFLCNELDTFPGVSYYRDEMMNIYITKGELSEGEYYPMFIAHTDTVHQKVDKIFTYRPTMDNFYTMRPKYNPSGDKSMERVFINAKFDDEENIT